MEEIVRRFAVTPMAIALLLAAPVATRAEPSGLKPLHARHLNSDRAVASAPTLGPFSLFATGPIAPARHEKDGLSRNPDDCAAYGCIDNN